MPVKIALHRVAVCADINRFGEGIVQRNGMSLVLSGEQVDKLLLSGHSDL